MEDKRPEFIPATQEQLIIARNKLWTSELNKLLRRWKYMIGKREKGHNHLTRKFSRRHYIFGGPSIILSSISSVGIFATFRNCDDCDDQTASECEIDQWIRLSAGVIMMISTALTAFLTFMNYADVAADHKAAADDFGALYRRIENLQTVPQEVRGDPISVLHDIRNTFDDLVRRSPTLPEKYDVSLDYEVVDNIKSPSKSSPPKPPPKPVFTPTTTDLKKLMNSEESSTDKTTFSNVSMHDINDRMERENEYNTEDEDQEVKIMFDLEDYTSTDAAAAAIAAAKIAYQKDQNEQKSLQAALIFEMSRLDRHAHLQIKDKETLKKSKENKNNSKEKESVDKVKSSKISDEDINSDEDVEICIE